MTERVLGPKESPRRKRLALLVPFIAIAALVLAIGASAGPVSSAAGFEGDDGNLADDAAAGIDWNNFASVTWTGTAPFRSADKTASGWEFKGLEDAVAPTQKGESVFGGGVKQDDNCAPVTNNPDPPNKDDLKRIYIASAVVSNKTYLALAWARVPQNSTSASAHVAFEFNQGATSCGGGSPLVNRSTANGGDMLIVYDFEGGSAPPVLKLLRWQSTGTCEQTGKSAATTGPCWVFALDLTAGGFAEARVNTTDALDAIAPAGSETLATQEFGEAIVDLTGAGVFPATPTSCLTFGRAYGVSRSSGNSGQAQMKDLVGPGTLSISNCGQVIIRKQTVPDEDPNTTDFTYSTNVQTLPGPRSVANFTLKDDGVRTINDVKPDSGRTVTETDPSPLYLLTSIDCSASTVPSGNISTNTTTRTVTFTIAADQVLDCTFTNTRQKLQSSMNTAPWIYPNDKATVTANAAFTDVQGTVKFRLFDTSANCNATTPSDTVGTGGLLYKETVTLPAATGTSKTVNTSNTSVKVESSTTVYWLVEYSGDANHLGRLSKCSESIATTLTADSSGGTNVP
jgi:hypothetical protein